MKDEVLFLLYSV